MTKLSGNCFCKKILFELAGPTDFSGNCHCESCRKSHGAAFVTWTSVPKERFKITLGEQNLKWYQSSDCIRWGFCSNCGGSLFYEAVKEGHHESPKTDRMYISAANIENMDREPAVHVSYEEKLPWLKFQDALPKYRGKMLELM